MSDAQTPDREPTLKEQLDQKALEVRQEQNQQGKSGLLEKVASYVPGASKILGQQAEGQNTNDSTASQPSESSTGPRDQILPKRPDHDEAIESFLKDQHRSTQGSDEAGIGIGAGKEGGS